MYSLGNAAPVVSPAYHDVPIQNQYSNPVRNGPYKKMTNYQLNGQIAGQINNNDENYEIYQTQTFPSPSLFIEQDTSMSGYEYTYSMDQYNDAAMQKQEFNQRQVPPQNAPSDILENYTNSEENSMDVNKQVRAIEHGLPKQNPYVPKQKVVHKNSYTYAPKYLNVDAMPNIAGYYNQPVVVPVRRPPVQRIIVKENADIKEVDDDDKTIIDDDDVKMEKKQKKKKVRKSKKESDRMMYFVILLLVIIIGLMLFIILGKQKRVRF